MAQGDFFTKSAVVAANGELVIDGSTSNTSAVELHTFASENGINVLKDVDVDGDGTFEIGIPISSSSSSIHSQQNKIEISSTSNMRLRIVENSGNSQGIHVTGIEVAD